LRETRLIVSDLRRTFFRTLAVVISVAVLVSLLFSTSALRIGSDKASLSSAERFGADMMILPPLTPSTFSYETAAGPILVVDNTTGFLSPSQAASAQHLGGVVETSPQVFVAVLNNSLHNSQYRLVGFDPSTDFAIRPWYADPSATLGANQALAGPATGFLVGGTIRYENLSLTVVGLLMPTNTSLDSTVLFPIPAGNAGSAVTAMVLKFAPGATLTNIENETKALGVVRVVEAPGLVSRVAADTTGLASYELLAEAIVGASVFVMMVLVFSMTTNERGRQLGVLRSLGATRRFILGNVLKEAALTAGIGSALGLLIGEVVIILGQNFLFANFNTPVLGLGFWESITLLVTSASLGILAGTAASALPAYRATRRDPYEAIRGGE